MVAHPIEVAIANGAAVNKATVREEVKQYPREFGTVAAFRLSDLPNVPNALIAGALYRYDSTDTTSADNGATVVLDASSRRYKKISGPQRVFLPADVTNNNASANTIADVTGLSFPVVAGLKYRFRFFIKYTAALTTTGARFSINGPAAPTQLEFRSDYTLTATTRELNVAEAYDLPAAAGATSLTTGNLATIEGMIQPSVDGTVIARFASEVSGSAIVAKSGISHVEYEAIG